MSNPMDDGRLQAWLDGEADAQTSREIEHYLREHPDVAREVEGWRQDALRLRQAVLRTDSYPLSRPHPATFRLRLQQQRLRRVGVVFTLMVALGAGGISGWQMKEHAQPGMPPMEDAVQAYRLFGDSPQLASMDIETNQSPQLDSWLRRYFINGTLPPRLEQFGYQLVGARLMASEQGAAAMVLYQTASGKRVAWYIRRQTTRLSKGMRHSNNLVAQYWSDDHYNYALITPEEGEKLPALRDAVTTEMG